MGKRDSEEQRKTEKEKGKVRGRKNRPETADTRKREREKKGERQFRRDPAPSIPGGSYIQLVFPILLEVLSEQSDDEKGND